MYSLLFTLVLTNGQFSTLVLDNNLTYDECVNNAAYMQHEVAKEVKPTTVKDFMLICRQEND